MSLPDVIGAGLKVNIFQSQLSSIMPPKNGIMRQKAMLPNIAFHIHICTHAAFANRSGLFPGADIICFNSFMRL